MAYLIDTDIYIYIPNGHAAILNRIAEVGEHEIFLSAISVAELYYGAYYSKKLKKNLKRTQKNLEKLQILNFTKNTAKILVVSKPI